METITAPVIDAGKEPTIADLGSMIDVSAPEKTETKPTPETKMEPRADKQAAAPAKEENPKSATGTDDKPQQDEPEEEVPPNVAKRIAAEAKKAAFFQSKIDKAVSERKAKQAEAEKLTGTPGSEPAKTTEPAKNERPKRPDRAKFAGTEAEYNAALDAYEQKLETWLEDRTAVTVEQKYTERQAREAQIKEWEAATAKHGKDFPQLMATLAEAAPERMQIAISALDDWSTVAVHLAKNEDELHALVEDFKVSPERAIAKLGKLEDRLKPDAKTQPAKEEKETPLPKPLKPVAGGPAGSNGKVDLQKASMPEFLDEIERMVKAG